MKTPFDPRHLYRQKLVQILFETSFQQALTSSRKISKQLESQINEPFLQTDLKKILKHLKKIDLLIKNAAPEWPVDKIARVDLAILRQAIFELILVKKTPIKVIIDEAVELAKEFGGDKSSQFVNGALGKIVNNLNIKN